MVQSISKNVKILFVPEKQLPKIIKGARKLSNKSLVDKSLVFDDENYFTLSNIEISGNGGYYTDYKQATSDYVKFKKKRKFESNVLAWVAISVDGMSKPIT